jgi:hypothetical protein
MFNFAVKKGQAYDITITPADAEGKPASLDSPPTVVGLDTTLFQASPLALNADGLTYNLHLVALKDGEDVFEFDAVGLNGAALKAEVDGKVTLPLATQLLVTGKVVS